MFENKNAALIAIILSIMVAVAGAGKLMEPRIENRPVPIQEGAVPQLPEELKAEEKGEPVLRVYISEEDRVEDMAFEEYIKGVVAGEMKPDWPEEALAAQAIIARSFTLQKIKEKGGVPEKNAHASTDIEEFQAYDADSITRQVKEAVDKTRGQVAVHQGNFIRGWFHAYAGPRTAQADEGLAFEGPNPPYIHVVKSPGSQMVPPEEGIWEESFNLEEVRHAVKEQRGNDPGPVEQFEIAQKGPSGRVTLFKVNDVQVSAPDLRIALGSTRMRSTYIEEMNMEGEKVIFEGKGFGHGVGMCQWGARAQAEEGLSAEEIVKYFYRDVEVVKLWE
ncbi:MAG: SpoIID/LytB domain-containing protein [Candidatus Syntrophonatronum acetioxidans]|uniref:SpoIID/LytB domain-containing protein n=1 Tax=Candidatus Syntrophonatronum acetioxidans TaxID=1795816 RepID=A0A424YJ36_9FIRM|nr:MAG: SpoIID/LytB domain-containing protein [Candidatus Syntrophonatronum acetioxidans]